MNIVDHDLLSIQQARVLAEAAREAQKTLASFSQQQLDSIVTAMVCEIRQHTHALAKMSAQETEYGNWQDKIIKNDFICQYLDRYLKDMACVGVIARCPEKKLMDIGVPVGVIAALPPATSPVSTVIHNTLIAIKSGNAIVFSPHPRAWETTQTALDILREAAEKSGLPPGAISYLHRPAESGYQELLCHPDVHLALITGVPHALSFARKTGKPVIYGGAGNGPVFIERTADIPKAVSDIISSRTFDGGVVSASEQSVVVDGPVARQVRDEFSYQGAYFMTEKEPDQLEKTFTFEDGRENQELVGKPATCLAQQAGFRVPPETTVLISEKPYISSNSPYSQARLFPVLAFYVEDDWIHACEKCIELLVEEGKGHTLVIHSNDHGVIQEFALRKPVSRVLVNTPATFGSMGATTNLAPSMTLGSGAQGDGVTADNVSPRNLITIRRVGYEVRQMKDVYLSDVHQSQQIPQERMNPTRRMAQVIEDVLERMVNQKTQDNGGNYRE